MKVEITKAQLLAIISITDDVSAMIGCASVDDTGFDWDKETRKRVKLVDNFLYKNGFKRTYK